jgi:hypothetical protein
MAGSPFLGRGEVEMLVLRRRHEAARQIASRLGVSVQEVFMEWRLAQERQRQWMKALDALGYKSGEDPAAFLRRVNAMDAKANNSDQTQFCCDRQDRYGAQICSFTTDQRFHRCCFSPLFDAIATFLSI